MDHGELTGADIPRFITAGKAVCTILNDITGNRFTFKIQKAKKNEGQEDRPDMFFVSVLTGPDNQNSYTYMGVLSNNEFRETRGSKVHADALSFQAFAWMIRQIAAGKPFPAFFRFYHEGRCGRCRRPFTVPESIRSGIGPECARRV